MKAVKVVGLLLIGAVAWNAYGAGGRAVKSSAVFVSPDGSDTNPGTEAQPLKTLEAVRDQLRAPPSRKGQATVFLKPGTYRFTQTFELDARDSRTTYKSYGSDSSDTAAPPREPARINGGRTISPSAVQSVTDATILDRLVETDARSHLLKIDLKAMGIDNYGELGPRGFRRTYIPAPLELFIDGKAQQVARRPNAGQKGVRLGKVIDGGSQPRNGDFSFRAGTFEYGTDRAEEWVQATDL